MNNKLLIIVILRYRTLIKVNWTKQEQIIGKLRKFWMNQTTIFYGILWFTEYQLSKRRLTSILPVRIPGCFNFIQQNSVNRISNHHFIYLPFQVNCKMFLYLICRFGYVFLVQSEDHTSISVRSRLLFPYSVKKLRLSFRT